MMKTAHKIIYGLIRQANCKLACIILCALFFCVEYKSLAEPENQQASDAVPSTPQTGTKPIKYKSDAEFFAQLEAELGYSKPQANNAVSTAPQAKTKPIKYKSGEEFFAQLEAELGYSKPQASGGIWETVKAFGRDLTHVPAEFVEGGQNTVDSLRLLMKYSDEFKTAVREDILNRIENENGFAEKFNSLRKKLDDDNLFRQAAYEAYAEKPEFKKYFGPKDSRAEEYSLDDYIVISFPIACILIPSIYICVQIYYKGFKALFSVKGRASRKTYWTWWIFIFPLFFLYSLIYSYIGEIFAYTEIMGINPFVLLIPFVIISCIILIFIFVPFICVQIRRLHDMNLSGLWYIILHIMQHSPILIVVKWMFLGCVPGTKAENKYGPPLSMTKPVEKQCYPIDIAKPEETCGEPACTVEKEYLKIKTSAKEKIRLLARDKKIQRTAFLAFFAGMALGILLMYMHFSRYEIQNMRGIIVKLDRQSGKIIKVIRDPEIGWEDYKKPNN